MRNIASSIVFMVGIALASGQTNGGIVVSNLNATVNGTAGIYTPPDGTDYAQEFLTGSQSVEMASIIAPLGDTTGTYTPFAELVADSGGLPGSTVLTSFIFPTIGTSYADLTFTPTSSVLLAADTPYWFVLGVNPSGDGFYKWQYTDTLDASLPIYAASKNSVATWEIGSPPGPFLIQVNSVPEPSSLLLLIIGGTMMMAAALRRTPPIAKSLRR
jgi:hypothetical protein